MRAVLPGWLLILSLLWAPSEADAQAEMASAVYEDVRSVIVELFEAEMARAIVPGVICHLDPAVHLYLRRTLQQIHERSYGSLGETIWGEVAALAESLVYAVIQEPGRSPEALLEVLKGGVVRTPRSVAACRELVRSQTYAGPADLRLFEALYTCPPGSPDHCSGFKSPAEAACPADEGDADWAVEAWACALGAATRSAISEQDAATRQRAAEALAVWPVWIHASRQAGDRTLRKWHAQAAAVMGALFEGQDASQIPGEAALLDRAKTLAWSTRRLISARSSAADVIANVRALIHDTCSLSGGEAEQLKAWCDAFNDSTKRPDRLMRLLDDVVRRDYTAAVNWFVELARLNDPERQAADALSERQSGDLGEEGGDDTDKDRQRRVLFGRLMVSMTTYALEARIRGVPGEMTREAFTKAARDALFYAVDANTEGFNRGLWSNLAVPQLGLRAAVSEGYVNASDDHSIRFPVSIDWLTLRARLWYSQRLYVAANFPLVDLVAPFAEVALRDPQRTYRESGRLWANLLAPRVELLIGLPQWSRNLAVAAGIRVLVLAPHGVEGGFEYKYVWDNPEEESGFDRSRHVEGFLGLKYIF